MTTTNDQSVSDAVTAALHDAFVAGKTSATIDLTSTG